MIYLLLLSGVLSLSMAQDFSGKDKMNDIAWSDHKVFPQKWQLVTIRFRRDTGEMRLTYANQLAMRTLRAGKTDYPDGAVFGKTGVHTSSDPQFESSVVPKGIRRYQLMVRDKKKYASTGGWGYALFDNNGKTFPEDPKVTQDACYACHTVVQNRGDVFSEPFDFVHDMKFPKTPRPKALPFFFSSVPVAQLPSKVSALLEKNTKEVRFFRHEKIRANVFQGTLDEMKPHLEDEARKSKLPAIFLSNDERRFVVALPKKNDECPESASFEIISTDLEFNTVTEKYCTHD